ncbi:MAG: hypothetical protein QW580_03510 [Nitrososphaerota archaeon]
MLAIFRVERYTYNWSSKMKAFFQFGRKSLLVANAIALIHNTLLNTREGDVILVDSTSSHIRNAFKPQLLKSSGMIKSEIKSSFLEFARQLVNSPQFREEAEKDMKAQFIVTTTGGQTVTKTNTVVATKTIQVVTTVTKATTVTVTAGSGGGRGPTYYTMMSGNLIIVPYDAFVFSRR